MRKQLAYNDDLSLLGQRVHRSLPRTTASTSGDRYRLYSPNSDGAHHRQKSAERPASEITLAASKEVCTKVTASKAAPERRPTYAVKINNLDAAVIPVVSGPLTRINDAHSVEDLQRLLAACTSTSPAVRQPPPSSSSTFSTARTRCVQVYQRCFLHHCTTLRDALDD